MIKKIFHARYFKKVKNNFIELRIFFKGESQKNRKIYM